MKRIKAMLGKDGGEVWTQIYVNPERISYIHPIEEGDLKSHYVVGFDLREYIVNKDSLDTIFEV